MSENEFFQEEDIEQVDIEKQGSDYDLEEFDQLQEEGDKNESGEQQNENKNNDQNEENQENQTKLNLESQSSNQREFYADEQENASIISENNKNEDSSKFNNLTKEQIKEQKLQQEYSDLKKQMLIQMLKNSQQLLTQKDKDQAEQNRKYVEYKVFWQFSDTLLEYTRKILESIPKQSEETMQNAASYVQASNQTIIQELLNGQTNVMKKKIISKEEIFKQSGIQNQVQSLGNINNNITRDSLSFINGNNNNFNNFGGGISSRSSLILVDPKARFKEDNRLNPEKLRQSEEFIKKIRLEKEERLKRIERQRAITEHAELKRKEEELEQRFKEKEKKHKEIMIKHHENLKQIKEKEEQRKHDQEQIKQHIRAHSQKKPLFKLLEERYEKNIMAPSLEQRKMRLQEIRNFKAQSMQEILQHQQNYDQLKKENEAKSKQKVSVNLDFVKGLYRSKAGEAQKQEQEQMQQQKVQEGQWKKERKQISLTYAKMVQDQHKKQFLANNNNKADNQDLQQENSEENQSRGKNNLKIPNLRSRRSQSNNQPKRKHFLVNQLNSQSQNKKVNHNNNQSIDFHDAGDHSSRSNDPHDSNHNTDFENGQLDFLDNQRQIQIKLGNQYMYFSKQIGKSNKEGADKQKEEMEKQYIKEQEELRKKQKINYLGEVKQKHRKNVEDYMDWENDLNDKNLSEKEKMDRVYQKAAKLDEELRKQEIKGNKYDSSNDQKQPKKTHRRYVPQQYQSKDSHSKWVQQYRLMKVNQIKLWNLISQ